MLEQYTYFSIFREHSAAAAAVRRRRRRESTRLETSYVHEYRMACACILRMPLRRCETDLVRVCGTVSELGSVFGVTSTTGWRRRVQRVVLVL